MKRTINLPEVFVRFVIFFDFAFPLPVGSVIRTSVGWDGSLIPKLRYGVYRILGVDSGRQTPKRNAEEKCRREEIGCQPGSKRCT
jgi:hypothetical protein